MKQKLLAKTIICHYDEIGLKGKNRKFFEDKLRDNIKQKLDENFPDSAARVKRISGRIIVNLAKPADENEIKEVLKNIFGIAYFAFAVGCEQEMGAIKKTALEILSEKEFGTFRISAQRSKKEFPLTSQEINAEVGEYVLENFGEKAEGGVRVNLKNPDANCFIEIVDSFAFLYLEKTRGAGGLPVGISGKVVVLLSGGIDSPVAAYYILKRGASAVFLHFHSIPFTSRASLEKTKELAGILSKFQPETKLFLAPFSEIQKEIMKKSPPKLRVILYRRFMMRIAERVAEREKALAIVTGESLGQVASQTLENISAIEKCSELPILRPVIGFDKKEIIAKAEEIGTYDVSVLPHEDCCSLFVPKRPETKAKIKEVEKAEEELDIENLVAEAIKNLEAE
ncbi:MAG: tRNA 4-thiouridine(8) synthase ThiI [bacterium]|nr:tRNA 4-thiouridine(8) synthase ThiI [bacterium]